MIDVLQKFSETLILMTLLLSFMGTKTFLRLMHLYTVSSPEKPINVKNQLILC